MEDGELDENEEDEIDQQIEEDERPAIKEFRKELNGDNFIIDRNGKKIKLFDPDEVHYKKTNDNYGNKLRDDVPIIYYI